MLLLTYIGTVSRLPGLNHPDFNFLSTSATHSAPTGRPIAGSSAVTGTLQNNTRMISAEDWPRSRHHSSPLKPVKTVEQLERDQDGCN